MRAPALAATDIARIFEPFLRAVFAWWRTHWARRVDRKAHRHNLRGSVALKNTGRVVRPRLRVYVRLPISTEATRKAEKCLEKQAYTAATAFAGAPRAKKTQQCLPGR
jgi:hypothetical protein